MTTFPFLLMNDLTMFSFIAGTNQDIVFTVLSSASAAVNLTGSSGSWKLSPYGQTTSVLTKAGVLSGSGSNVYTISLVPADTNDLSGKYVHQLAVTDTSGSVYRPSQGLIQIIPRIV